MKCKKLSKSSNRFCSLQYEIGFKYVKENLLGREFQESHEKFCATFERKVAGIESHEDSKIKILHEFEVAKCLKRGEIFQNNALN